MSDDDKRSSGSKFGPGPAAVDIGPRQWPEWAGVRPWFSEQSRSAPATITGVPHDHAQSRLSDRQPCQRIDQSHARKSAGAAGTDRKGGGKGKRVAVSVDLGGGRIYKKKHNI